MRLGDGNLMYRGHKRSSVARNVRFKVLFTKGGQIYDQWRSQPDNLVPLCKFQIIIIIHLFTS